MDPVKIPSQPIQSGQPSPTPSPDGTGLEPDGDPMASVPQAGGRTRPSPAAGAPKLGRTSWVDRPITVAIILSLAMPSVVEQLISAAVGFTDTIVAGHTYAHDDTANAAAAGAVAAMTYLQWFAGLMTTALGVGATAIVARAIGARRPRMANRVAGTVCAAAFLVGIAVAVVFYAGAPFLVRLFKLKGIAGEFGIQYLRIMCWTVCFQTAGQIGAACLRGAGDTMRPLLVTLGISLVNGIASPALTFGWWGLPAMGVRGNATGTLLAFAVSGVCTFAFLLHGSAGIKLQLRYLKIVPHLLMRVIRIGLPSWMEHMLLWIGQAMIVYLVMSQVDDAVGISGATLAAHGATLRIESLAFLPGYGFGIACSTLVGQFLGAKKPAEAQRAAILCNRLGLTTMCLAAVPMVFIPGTMLHLMVDSAPVMKLGMLPLVLAGLAQPGFAMAIIKSSALRGAGETLSPMIATMTGMVARVILVVSAMPILAHYHHADWGLIAVWVCIFMDLTFRGIFLNIVFRRGKWKHIKV